VVKMTLLELQKQRIKLAKTEPLKAKIIGLVVAEAKGIAKEAGEDPGESHIQLAAKRQMKATEKTIKTLKELNQDTSEAEAEAAELAEFLPKKMSEEALKAELDKIIAALPEEERNNKSRGKIMGQLKSLGDSVDMGMASKLLGSLLG